MAQIIITGASRGIGRAVAECFAREGWDLAICSRNEKEIRETKEQLLSLNPRSQIIAEQVDISLKKEVIAFGKKIIAASLKPEILVNNAGIFHPGNILEEAEGVLEQTMSVNLYGAYYLTRVLLPAMMTNRKGHVFNICSTASLKAYPQGGSYSISKFALLGFSKNLREEVRSFDIRVTSVIPGPVLTDSWKEVDVPEGRMMAPGDVASAIWSASQLPSGAVVEEILLRPMWGDMK